MAGPARPSLLMAPALAGWAGLDCSGGPELCRAAYSCAALRRGEQLRFFCPISLCPLECFRLFCSDLVVFVLGSGVGRCTERQCAFVSLAVAMSSDQCCRDTLPQQSGLQCLHSAMHVRNARKAVDACILRPPPMPIFSWCGHLCVSCRW